MPDLTGVLEVHEPPHRWEGGAAPGDGQPSEWPGRGFEAGDRPAVHLLVGAVTRSACPKDARKRPWAMDARARRGTAFSPLRCGLMCWRAGCGWPMAGGWRISPATWARPGRAVRRGARRGG